MRTGAKYKIARRLGDPGIFSKTQSPKFALSESRRKGDTRKKGRRGQRSEFGTQLIEKQKARYTYGLSERQFSNYVKTARTKGTDAPNVKLFKMIEGRLDNVVFRLGFANSRPFARQLVGHGHIKVNGRRVTIPSAQVRAGDIVSVRPESQGRPVFNGLKEKLKGYNAPNWLSLDVDKMEGTVVGTPAYDPHDSTLNFRVIIEFYSRV